MKPALTFTLLLASLPAHAADGWWNESWSQRQKITLDLSPHSSTITTPLANTPILIRLHDGNFPFASASPDGSDLRFIASDGKTALPFQIESFDGLLNEAFVWVKLPEVVTTTPQEIHLYFGNSSPSPLSDPSTNTFDADTALIYHFNEVGTPAQDSTKNANHSQTPFIRAEGSCIGGGARLDANTSLTIPSSPSLMWKAGGSTTLSLWIKPTAPQDNATLIARGEESTGFRLSLNQGIPALRIGTSSVASASAVTPGSWTHLAVVAEGGSLRLFVNGLPAATLDASLPASEDPITLGASRNGFSGDIDELSISSVARTASWVSLTAINQGTDETSQRAVVVAPPEGGTTGSQSHLLEHLSLFGDIANNMMFDGWIAIGVCAIMIVIGWTVAIRKFFYLNSIEKGTREFLKQWQELSSDLTAIDIHDEGHIDRLTNESDPNQQALIRKSPLYHIYHIGAGEIRRRLGKGNTRSNGLSGRSIQAIRASLDAGLVHENHRLTDGLVYLTISIAGGPYVGLLGTVVGVMITFAIIAKSGEVNVNSIAPGIASALLATVVGLVVAIPALFIYSYLNGRIKNSLALMQVFIDEFVARMAEFYQANTSDASASEESTTEPAH